VYDPQTGEFRVHESGEERLSLLDGLTSAA
jgi:hypothetical protein